MSAHERPLSPHLQVMSILHRLTGIVLGIGTVALVYWLMAAASGPHEFKTAQLLAGSIVGRLLLFGWTMCLVYHLLNGVRHLVWDSGRGLELEQTYLSGRLVLIATALLTIAIWIAGYAVAGNWFAGGAQ
jgi:succinate dehydrogenase / fumarate reductase cytochrome b subunit